MLYACGEATNARLGLGISHGNVPIPRQITSLRQYVIKKVAVHSGKSSLLCTFFSEGSDHYMLVIILPCFFIFSHRWSACDGINC